MILIALGANLPSDFGTPVDTIQAAMNTLELRGVEVIESSRIWLTAPWPYNPDDDWFRNSVISVQTELSPHQLLDLLLSIEEEFGRVRTEKNAPRLLDMDILAYNGEVIKDGERLIVPHPLMHERSFVLMPLSDVSKKWVHPITGQNVEEMMNSLPPEPDGQEARPLEGTLDV